jgi:hypothetical protein
MYLTATERQLNLVAVAWVPAPAGDDTGRPATMTHYTAGGPLGEVAGTRTLCNRRLPDTWDIAGGRFEVYGNGICGVCERRFSARASASGIALEPSGLDQLLARHARSMAAEPAES